MNRDTLTKTIDLIFEEKIKMIGVYILTSADIKHRKMHHRELVREITNDFKYKLLTIKLKP